MCSPQLRQALVSTVCVIALFSGCAAPYASIGGASEIQLAPDTYRVLFSPTGYISWDLAYRAALLRCAELTVETLPVFRGWGDRELQLGDQLHLPEQSRSRLL